MPSPLQALKTSTRAVLRSLGAELQKYPTPPDRWATEAFPRLLLANAGEKKDRLTELEQFLLFACRHHHESRSQLLQDLFVRWILNNKQAGYFVEFGATDGISLSNTYFLEKDLGWNGILAEPAQCWHDKLRSNRHCHLDQRCVWVESGQSIDFTEVDIAALSAISTIAQTDSHFERRRAGKIYEVETVTLNDLLEQFQAPSFVDYLSIDTEGSEFQILQCVDFTRYTFGVITVEHNYCDNRNAIHELLTTNGYERKFSSISDFDDWYVHASFAKAGA